mmetsp:Transcript_10424/g.38720  ORF Transcript_10424/g.38720 Transcript_10424/m.38720 type:complete len:473 (+) Transcript_10424:1872-3290(+)
MVNHHQSTRASNGSLQWDAFSEVLGKWSMGNNERGIDGSAENLIRTSSTGGERVCHSVASVSNGWDTNNPAHSHASASQHATQSTANLECIEETLSSLSSNDLSIGTRTRRKLTYCRYNPDANIQDEFLPSATLFCDACIAENRMEMHKLCRRCQKQVRARLNEQDSLLRRTMRRHKVSRMLFYTFQTLYACTVILQFVMLSGLLLRNHLPMWCVDYLTELHPRVHSALAFYIANKFRIDNSIVQLLVWNCLTITCTSWINGLLYPILLFACVYFSQHWMAWILTAVKLLLIIRQLRWPSFLQFSQPPLELPDTDERIEDALELDPLVQLDGSSPLPPPTFRAPTFEPITMGMSSFYQQDALRSGSMSPLRNGAPQPRQSFGASSLVPPDHRAREANSTPPEPPRALHRASSKLKPQQRSKCAILGSCIRVIFMILSGMLLLYYLVSCIWESISLYQMSTMNNRWKAFQSVR